MAPRNSGALVIGFRRDDQRRYSRAIPTSWVPGRHGGLTRVPAQVVKLPLDLQCHIQAGSCVGCGATVYLNQLGYSAVRERDADVCCMECEDRYSADISRSL